MYRICFVLFLVATSLCVKSQSYIELSRKLLELFTDGKYAEAIPVALKVKEAAKKEFGETSVNYASSLHFLATSYKFMGNYSAAEPAYKQASGIYEKALKEPNPEYLTKINSRSYTDNLNDLAYLYVMTGNYTAAEPLYKQALDISKKQFGEEDAQSLTGLAILYISIGNYNAAEPLCKQAIGIRKKQFGEEDPIYATSLNNLASLYERKGNYAAAEPLYIQVSAIYKKLSAGEHPVYASALNNLAGLYVKMGNYTAAETLFRQALAIRKKVWGEEHPDYAQSLNNLAELYYNMGNYSASESLYKQALSIYKKAMGEEHPDYASCLNNLAEVYVNMENYALAEPLDKQALAIRKKVLGVDHPDYATSLNNLASLYMYAGNYRSAEPLLQQALAIQKKSSGEEDPGYAISLNNLSLLYESTGNYTAAAKYLIQGSNLTFKHISKNIYTLSEVEKLKWWETKRGEFWGAPSLLSIDPKASTSFLQQACTQQLQLKGFILNDGAKVLQEAREKGNPQLQQLFDQWQNNKAILTRQYSLPVGNRMAQLDSLEKQTNDQEKRINQQSSVFRTSRENQQIGFTEVHKQLKQGEAAVEFIRFASMHMGQTPHILYSAFIILPNDIIPHFINLCEEKQLSGLLESKTNSSEQFVKQLYRGVALVNMQGDGKKGDSLYNLVWKPLQPWLKGIKKISIAPAGLLNRVAFNALPVDSNSYLIDKYQLRQYSSIRQLAEKKIPVSNTTVATDAVLYGGIDFLVADNSALAGNGKAANILPDNVKRSIRGGVWNPLPGTLQEVNSIARLFDANKKTTRVVTGSAATEESLKQLSGHSPAILHLATHGFSLPDAEQKIKTNISNSDYQFTMANNPLLHSGIIMAGANRVWSGAAPITGKEDGIVTAYEISNLDLSNTGLVVLSACETALGDIKGTEGVFGLQRAFKLAGVQNMILSLWQVPDKETAELMDLLYTNKLKGMTNYDAFNKAQDIMRKKYSPYYWAAFVLIE